MSGRRITKLFPKMIVRYASKENVNQEYEVMKVYSYNADLRNTKTNEIVCVGVGDLVIAGIEPQMV